MTVNQKLSENQFFLLLRATRPRQWVKNLAVFAAIIFNGLFFKPDYLIISFKSFIVLCLLSSSSYLINDLADLENDKHHPYKKDRPLASGKLKTPFAKKSAILFLIFAFLLSWLTSIKLVIMSGLFFALQLSYTFFFKKIPVIDILVIAGAYILRVYTGETVTGQHLSVWLMLSVISLALFLSTAKRRAELAMLALNKKPVRTRDSLKRYNTSLLDVYLSFFATSTWISYGFYTFTHKPPPTNIHLLQKILPFIATYKERKWLMLSIPFVLYGIMRYLQLIYEQGEGEAPEKLFFLDINLLLTVIGWGISLVITIYLI